MKKECLGLFAKYWQPNAVKTRLAATVGPERAAEIYRNFVVTLVQRLADCGDDRWVAITPWLRATEFREIVGEPWHLEAQSEDDNLGSRMRAFFAGRFTAVYDRVVLLGSDSPNVPIEYVRQAFEGLRTHDVVLGPTEDGGYWLVGAAGAVPPIFDAIPWSTPQVWDATLEAIQTANLRYAILPVWYDVDESSDLKRLTAELQDGVGQDPALDRLLAAINDSN